MSFTLLRIPILLLALHALLFAAQASAGGAAIPSVQDGDWADGTTWQGGSVPVGSLFQDARIRHVVSVTTSGNTAQSVTVGFDGLPGVLDIVSGDIDASFTIASNTASGTMNVTGGTATGGIFVGSSPTSGTLDVSGGTLTNGGLQAGRFAGTGNVVIRGSGATITRSSQVRFGDAGVLTLVPTANGAPGLSVIDTTTEVVLDPGSTLVLDASSYAPSVGDAWTVFSFASTLTGSFGNLVAPPGLALVEDTSTPGTLVVRVVSAAAVPGLEGAGLLLLALALSGLGALALARRRPPREI